MFLMTLKAKNMTHGGKCFGFPVTSYGPASVGAWVFRSFSKYLATELNAKSCFQTDVKTAEWQ